MSALILNLHRCLVRKQSVLLFAVLCGLLYSSRLNAQDPMHYSGKELGEYSPFIFVNSDNVAKVEPLWLKDLTPAYISDTNENNHNMFIIGDIVYCYIEIFDNNNKHFLLRRFDLKSGNVLEPLTGPLSELGKNTSALADDAGHIVVAKITNTNANLLLNFTVYNTDLTKVGDYSFQNKSNHRIAGFCEWLRIEGDATSDGKFVLSGRYSQVPSSSDTSGEWPCVPALITLQPDYSSASPGNLGATVKSYATDGENSLSDLYLRNHNTISGSVPASSLLSVVPVNDDFDIVQGFTNEYISNYEALHTYPLLFKKDANTDLSVFSADGHYKKAGVMGADHPLYPKDKLCYGGTSVSLAGVQLVIMPTTCNSEDGVKFNVGVIDHPSTASSPSSENAAAYLPENSSAPEATLDDIKEIFTLPAKSVKPAGYPAAQNIYLYERPFVKASKNTDGSGTAIVTYMPGMHLAAYNLRIAGKKPSGNDSAAEIENPPYKLDGRRLIVRTNEKSPVALMNMAGQVVMSFDSTDIFGGERVVDLHSVASGVYILRIGEKTSKVLLR